MAEGAICDGRNGLGSQEEMSDRPFSPQAAHAETLVCVGQTGNSVDRDPGAETAIRAHESVWVSVPGLPP